MNVAVLGVGLIGGSIGLAARRRADAQVCGYDPDERVRAKALELGAIDRAAGDIAEADPRLATLQFLNLHNHTYQWARASQPWSASELSTAYFRTLMLGFGAKASAVERAEATATTLLNRLDAATASPFAPAVAI